MSKESEVGLITPPAPKKMYGHQLWPFILSRIHPRINPYARVALMIRPAERRDGLHGLLARNAECAAERAYREHVTKHGCKKGHGAFLIALRS